MEWKADKDTLETLALIEINSPRFFMKDSYKQNYISPSPKTQMSGPQFQFRAYTGSVRSVLFVIHCQVLYY